jgi:hypothetical protein
MAVSKSSRRLLASLAGALALPAIIGRAPDTPAGQEADKIKCYGVSKCKGTGDCGGPVSRRARPSPLRLGSRRSRAFPGGKGKNTSFRRRPGRHRREQAAVDLFDQGVAAAPLPANWVSRS